MHYICRISILAHTIPSIYVWNAKKKSNKKKFVEFDNRFFSLYCINFLFIYKIISTIYNYNIIIIQKVLVIIIIIIIIGLNDVWK